MTEHTEGVPLRVVSYINSRAGVTTPPRSPRWSARPRRRGRRCRRGPPVPLAARKAAALAELVGMVVAAGACRRWGTSGDQPAGAGDGDPLPAVPATRSAPARCRIRRMSGGPGRPVHPWPASHLATDPIERPNQAALFKRELDAAHAAGDRPPPT